MTPPTDDLPERESQQEFEQEFEHWLTRYGAAWSSRQPDAAAALFTEDAEYYWTPLQAPMCGREEIVAAWRAAIDRQKDVRFRFDVLAVCGSHGIAHWRTSMVRRASGEAIEVDGVLLAEFDEAGLCRCFREWWHSSEASPAGPNSARSKGRSTGKSGSS